MYTHEDTRVHAREDDAMPTDDEVMAQYAATQQGTNNQQ